MQDDADAVDIILKRRRTRTQRVVNFGFKHGWTKADGWCIVTIKGSCLSCDIGTLTLISTTSECKTKRRQRSARTVNWQCTRHDNSMHAMEAPWERQKSAVCNCQVELHRNAMKLRRNKGYRENAVKKPRHRHLHEKCLFSLGSHYTALGEIQQRYDGCMIQSQWKRRLVWQRF